MAYKNDPATAAARSQLYLSRVRVGRVFNRTVAFYSGSPTTPTNFTGNQILGTHSGGAGGGLLNGMSPSIEVPLACEELIIENVEVSSNNDNLFVTVTYSSPDPSTDIYVLFNQSTGQSFGAVSVSGSSPVTALFPHQTLLPNGFYSLRVSRAADPAGCFDVRNGLFNRCAITAGTWSLPGGVPFPPNVLPIPTLTELGGSGFFSCPLDVAVERTSAGTPATLPISGLTVVSDTLLSFTVENTTAATGDYVARVFCTNLGCEDLSDNSISFGILTDPP